MRAASATPEIHPLPSFPLDAVEVHTRYRGLLIGARCLVPGERPELVVGSEKGVHAPAPEEELGCSTLSLLRLERDALYVTLAPRMTGALVYDNGRREELASGAAVWLVPPSDAELQIACGDVSFAARRTDAASHAAAPITVAWPRPAARSSPRRPGCC
jgi:hypothetical protein